VDRVGSFRKKAFDKLDNLAVIPVVNGLMNEVQ
jgi:hypothetical protein